MAVPVANPFLIGCALVLGAGVVLSLGAFCVRFSADMSPWAYIFWRSLAFSAVLIAISVARSGRGPVAAVRGLGTFGIIGAVMMLGAATFFIAALSVTTLAETFFVCSLAPLLTALLARPVLGERIGTVTIAAIAIALLGVWLMIGDPLSGGSWLGRGLALLSALSYAGFSLCTRGAASRDLDGMLIAFGLMSIPLGIAGTLVTGTALVPSANSVVFAILHGAFVLAAGMFMIGQGSRFVPAVTMTMLVQTEAVLAPLWGYLAFDETIAAATIAGGALILTAVVLQAFDAKATSSGGSRES